MKEFVGDSPFVAVCYLFRQQIEGSSIPIFILFFFFFFAKMFKKTNLRSFWLNVILNYVKLSKFYQNRQHGSNNTKIYNFHCPKNIAPFHWNLNLRNWPCALVCGLYPRNGGHFQPQHQKLHLSVKSGAI